MLIPLTRGTEGVNKSIILALSLFITLPAAAQTLSLSASGNCGGTPANCGTDGDREADTRWPGLQVNEGDTVTFRVEASPASGQVSFQYSLIGSAANLTDLGQIQGSGANTGIVSGIPNRNPYNFAPVTGYVQNIIVPVSTDSTSEPDESLTVRIDTFLNSLTAAPLTLPSPSSVTVTIRGTDTAPTFGTASVSNQVFRQNTPITPLTIPEATGGNGPVTYTATTLPTGLSFQGDCGARILCGTPTTLTTGAQTVTITAADADSNTASTDTNTLMFTMTVVPHPIDLNNSGTLDANDALVLFRHYSRVPVTEDEATRADDWKENGRAQGGDLNSDGPINQSDALIMYYAYEFGDLLDQSAVLRQLLLNGVRGRMPDTDATYRELLRRANRLQ